MKEKYRFLTINAQYNPAWFILDFNQVIGHGDQPLIELQPLDEEDEELINQEEADNKNYEE